ncbi:MAG: nucleotidyltransferase family protein, partial [Bacteroidota bacterium]
MKAMVLAAGKGSRLRPLTNDIPKPLIPIHGRPMIDYALGYLQKNGVDEVIINVHHLADDLKEYFNSNSFSGKVKITLSDESGKLLDTGGGLK